MSKSARDERPWGFKGKQVLGPPVTAEDLRSHIVDGCGCLGCEGNRLWLERYYGIKREVQEPVSLGEECPAGSADMVAEDEVLDLPPEVAPPVLARVQQILLEM